MPDKLALRSSAVTAVVGAVVFLWAGALHPAGADPGDSAAAFAEYAADRTWVAVHLGQFFGALLLLITLLILRQTLAEDDRAKALARLGGDLVVATIAVLAVLQAVDGVALKHMVDVLAAAPAATRDAAFLAAEAVRWIEVGLNGFYRFCFGLTLACLGAAVFRGRTYPLGLVGLVSGVAWTATGFVVTYHGFWQDPAKTGVPQAAMAVAGAAMLAHVLWVPAIGVQMYRLAGRAPAAPAAPLPTGDA
jgi:hypothetical protein